MIIGCSVLRGRREILRLRAPSDRPAKELHDRKGKNRRAPLRMTVGTEGRREGAEDASEDFCDCSGVLSGRGDDGGEVYADGCRDGADSGGLRSRVPGRARDPVSGGARGARSEAAAARGGREVHRERSGDGCRRRILGHGDCGRRLQALLLRSGGRADRLHGDDARGRSHRDHGDAAASGARQDHGN